MCSGSFDTVFDWVRTVGTKKKYSSVFFRGDTMWVYENTNGRVKYGDPRAISDMWTGVPNDLDAALQILPRSSTQDDLYFFKGELSFLADYFNSIQFIVNITLTNMILFPVCHLTIKNTR